MDPRILSHEAYALTLGALARTGDSTHGLVLIAHDAAQREALVRPAPPAEPSDRAIRIAQRCIDRHIKPGSKYEGEALYAFAETIAAALDAVAAGLEPPCRHGTPEAEHCDRCDEEGDGCANCTAISGPCDPGCQCATFRADPTAPQECEACSGGTGAYEVANG
jgi:hypothetical protein